MNFGILDVYFIFKVLEIRELSLLCSAPELSCSVGGAEYKRGEAGVVSASSPIQRSIVMETRPPPHYCLAPYQVY